MDVVINKHLYTELGVVNKFKCDKCEKSGDYDPLEDGTIIDSNDNYTEFKVMCRYCKLSFVIIEEFKNHQTIYHVKNN